MMGKVVENAPAKVVYWKHWGDRLKIMHQVGEKCEENFRVRKVRRLRNLNMQV